MAKKRKVEKPKKSKKAAGLWIDKPGMLTEQGRRDIAEWLREQAKQVLKDDLTATGRYTAGYHYY